MFSRLRTRIIVFCAALLGIVQLLAFVLVNAANTTNAHQKIESELRIGERVFARLLEQNRERLTQAARVLSADYAFREAIATNDVDTVLSALKNHGTRINADTMMLISMDGHVIADTLRPAGPAESFIYPELLAAAKKNGAGSSIELLGKRPYQLVVVPVLAPVPIAWVVLGFVIDDSLAGDLRQLTALDVSFLSGSGNSFDVLASTLDKAHTEMLLTQLRTTSREESLSRIGSGKNEQQIKIIAIQQHGTNQITAVLQRSVAAATAVFDKLQNTLLLMGLTSLILSLVGSALIALNITQPLNRLADAASRIQGGDYTTPVVVNRNDEIGVLAGGLNQMREGISQREQEILRLAYEDTLTGLPNRALFNKWLTEAIEGTGGSNSPIGVLVMDLNRFKYVNETLGHGAGDHVLREVAFRLGQLAPGAGAVARLGGDEFAVLVNPLDSSQIKQFVTEISSALEAPISYRGQWLDVDASIGVAVFPAHGQDPGTLMRNADIAMYVAKRNKSGHVLYDSQLNTHTQEYLSMLGELRRAVELNELKLHYQPKLSLATDDIVEVEGLLRWEHPVRGMVSPGEFITFAEHTGFIKVLTQWVLEESVRQCAAWVQLGMPLRVSANISARDLMNKDLPGSIAKLLKRYSISPDLLCIEITESGFMDDPNSARRTLQELHDLGLHLSIDDYGTGYSSLSYIAQLPVHELKIDRSFISKLTSNPVTATIVRSTIELGHNLGLKVVAEGVENVEELDLLRQMGCDRAQGYFISKPVAPAKLEEFLMRRRKEAREKTLQDEHAGEGVKVA